MAGHLSPESKYFPFEGKECGLQSRPKILRIGKPLVGPYLEPAEEWPMEIAPRSRIGLYLDRHALEGVKFANAAPAVLNGKPIWEAGRAYAMTECGHTFISPRLSKRSIEMLSKGHKIKLADNVRKTAANQAGA